MPKTKKSKRTKSEQKLRDAKALVSLDLMRKMVQKPEYDANGGVPAVRALLELMKDE